jgi:hypothetical protein
MGNVFSSKFQGFILLIFLFTGQLIEFNAFEFLILSQKSFGRLNNFEFNYTTS